MALDAEEQELFDFAVAALPSWFTSDERNREELYGFAKTFGAALATVKYWFAQTYISGAVGPASGLPDWLNQHAVDVGTRRQNLETDPALRVRIRNAPDAVTPGALISGANAILASASIAGSAVLVELPRDAAGLGTFNSDTGVGGTFTALTAPNFLFTPTVPFAMRPYRNPGVVRLVQQFAITIAGAAHAANDGTFTAIGLSGNGIVFANGAGVAGVDAGASWTTVKRDRLGNNLDGHGKAFCSRGFRATHVGTPLRFVMILPYGSTAGTESSVREMLRQRKAIGFAVSIERRLSP